MRSLEFLPLHQRFQLLEPLFTDDVTSVRMEVARSLAGVPLDQVTAEQAAALEKLFGEFVRIQRLNADMPAAQLQLGVFYVTRGDLPSAEAAYREALHLNPQLVPAHLNLADLLRAQARDDEARAQLLKALAFAPSSGDTLHALGLLETRSGNKSLAMEYLERAARLESTGTRHRFVYAIALHDLGEPARAVTELQALLRRAPGNQEVLLALANYSAELGRKEQALGYARSLVEMAPGNRSYQQLYRQLGGS